MTADCAVCYVTDLGYLLPSLVSAVGLRKFVPSHKADVYIFLVDQEERIAELNRILSPYEIRCLPMDSVNFASIDKDKLRKTYFNSTNFGCLFMGDLLPDSCRKIVYIDGDTWIRRDPTPLIEADVPEGKFLAAEDMLSFRAAEPGNHGRNMKTYIERLGVDRHKYGYFNSGVYATSRNTWRIIMPEARKFANENTALCDFYDQSALNAVMGDRRLRLSTKWNFQTPYRYLNAQRQVDPHIYHFSGHPKPWMGPCEPYPEMYPEYQSAIAPFDSLKLPIKKIDDEAVKIHNNLNLNRRILMKHPLLAQFVLTCLGYNSYEKKAWL